MPCLTVQFISCSSPPPCPIYLLIIVFKHAQCTSLPPSPPPFPPPAVQFISRSSPPMPRLSHYKGYLSMPTACLDPSLPPLPLPPFPPPSGSVYLMLLPPPPRPVYLIKIVLKHAQCMPRSVPAPIPALSGSVPPFPPPVVQFISSPLPPMPRLSHSMPSACLDPSLPPSPLPPFPISCSSPAPHARLSHKNRI